MSFGVAVIGLGRWGPNHVRVFGAIADAEVVAAAEVDEACRERSQARHPQIEHCAEYADILTRRDLDAVVVATPTTTHYEIVKQALQAGKHVLCEKPLTTSSREAWELVALAEDQNVQLMASHVFLFNPGIVSLEEAVNDRRLTGKVYYLNAVRTNLGPFRSDVNAAWDLASHDLYVFNHLLGERPTSVSAVGSAYLRESVEDIVFLTLKYPSEVIGHVHVSWLDPKKIRQMTVVGEKRMVTWDEHGAPGPVMIYERSVTRERSYDTFGEFQLLTREGDVAVPRVPSREPLAAQAEEFVNRCATGKPREGRATGVEGAEVVDILAMASRSLAGRGELLEIEYGG